MTQNERLAAEEDLIKRVRGQKRKREALEHRWGWRNFDLSGQEISRFERFNIHSEVEKLKALVLPIEARDIYTGKGIRLPRSHHTRSPHKQLPKDGMFPTPLGYHSNAHLRSSAKIVSALGRNYDQTEVPPTTPKPITAWEARLQSQQNVPSVQGGLIVQSMPVPGLHPSQTPKPPSRPILPETPSIVDVQDNQPSVLNFQPTLKMHEQVETIEVIKPEDGDRDQTKSEMATIPETPIDRPRSLLAPSASPEIFVPNPLSPMPMIHQDFMSEERKKELMYNYNNLTKHGNVEFPDMLKLSEASLSNNQIQYLRMLYEVTTQKSIFGENEFVAFACLAKIIENLGPESSQHFINIDFESLPESILQYSELFSSVDRTNKGQIGVTALIQILSTTLQTNLKKEKLLAQIMNTLKKVGDETISKLEFLANLPYFISLEGAE